MQDGLADFKHWYFQKPLITRTFLTATFIQCVGVSLGFVTPYSLAYDWRLTIFSLNIWRPLTALTYLGKFGFNLIFEVMMAYLALNNIETKVFSKENYADYLWLQICLIVSVVLISTGMGFYFYADMYLLALIYIWCKRSPFQEIRIYFGFVVKSGYFPWVYLLIKALLQQPIVPLLIGIALGHLYIYLKDIVVIRYHKDYLQTPQFLRKWWHKPIAAQAPVGGPPRFFAGHGVRLD